MSEISTKSTIVNNTADRRKVWESLLIVCAMGLMGWAFYNSYPYFYNGVVSYQQYLKPDWAHQSVPLESLLQLSLSLWWLFTVVYFSLWAIHRSIRKLKGKSWRILFRDERLHFFPNVLLYLRVSCFFLALVWLFVIAQYPLQFLK